MTAHASPEVRAEALARVRGGATVSATAEALGISAQALQRWCASEGVRTQAGGSRDQIADRAVIACIARRAAGESLTSLAPSLGWSARYLGSRIRQLELLAEAVQAARGAVEAPRVVSPAPAAAAPRHVPTWLRELAASRVRVELRLVDDGLGGVRLLAAITGGDGETRQESYAPASLGWHERVLMHLAGVCRPRPERQERPAGRGSQRGETETELQDEQ